MECVLVMGVASSSEQLSMLILHEVTKSGACISYIWS